MWYVNSNVFLNNVLKVAMAKENTLKHLQNKNNNKTSAMKVKMPQCMIKLQSLYSGDMHAQKT